MGIVYEALDRERDLRVALKTLRHASAHSLYRFKREFRALQGLEHPNLVRLGELIEEEGEWFYTMEYVDGVDFVAHIRGQSASPPASSGEVSPSADTLEGEQVVAGARKGAATTFDESKLRAALGQLASGVAALHAAGKVHRDIKPSNILVDTGGRVVVLDFGLIAELRETPSSTPSNPVGTPEYMSPEQAASGSVGPPADWYSVGVMLYEALTGRLPFVGKPLKMLMEKQTRNPPAPSSLAAGVPADLDRLCVELLRVEPERRPSSTRVLRVLLGSADPSPLTPEPSSILSQGLPFVGRTEELELLRTAYSDSQKGEPVVVLVRGESGSGKSELVRQFTDEVARSGAVVLAGRCYERESVPYKAFDGIADALSRYMVRLPDADAAALLPLRADLLPRLFPVLRRVEMIARAPRGASESADPQERRTRMFKALRELFIRLSQRRPLVLFIDDLQWADTDSLTLLGELMHPPDAPQVLLVAVARTRSAEDDPYGDARWMGDQVHRLELGGLPPEHARELVEVISPRLVAEQSEVVEAIAEEARGHPMYILELVRHVEEQGMPAAGVMRLEDALWGRIANLEPAPLRLLEVLAVAGTPIAQEVAAHATRQDYPVFEKAAAMLRVAFLARTSGARETDTIEPYHDRVTDAVLASTDRDRKVACHERLAIALERAGAANSDPQALVRHLEGAGESARAARRAAEAGLRAADALAFDRAAAFFQTALRLGDYDATSRRDLLVRLGETIANSGRGQQAAEAFLEAAEGADPAMRLVCRRRAAEQLLISGRIEEGLRTIDGLLSDLGAPMPTSPRRALMSLLWQRAKLKMRGLRWRERHESEIAEQDLMRLDVYKAVAQGLGVVDTVRGMDYQAREILLALRTGQTAHVGRGLAMEAIYRGTRGSRSGKTPRRLLARAREIAERTGDPYLIAWGFASEGTIRYFESQFLEAVAALERGEQMMKEIPGTIWESSSLRILRLFALRYMGAIAQQAQLHDEYVRDADRRGDRYLETTVRRLCHMIWLARDDPDGGRKSVAQASWMPPEGVFHLQHWYALEAESEAALYEGRVPDVIEELRPRFVALWRSLLPHLQTVRAQSHWLWGRLMLALLVADPKAANARRQAARMARRCARERIGYSEVWGDLLLAGVARQGGDDDEARRCLEAAIEGADANHMRLCAAAARLRLGAMSDGDRDVAEARDAGEAWMRAEGIADAERMSEVVAPGF